MKFFEKLFIKTPPENDAEKYIFLVDSQELELSIISVGFRGVYISEEDATNTYTVDSFIECIDGVRFGGKYEADMTYVPCLTKKLNQKIIDALGARTLKVLRDGWKLFYKKQYLAKDESQNELKNVLAEYIECNEGTRKELAVKDKERAKSIISSLYELNAFSNYTTDDKGFGELFADVFKGVHRYNPSIKDFMYYDGSKWIEDVEGLAAKSSAKLLSEALAHYALDVGGNDYARKIMALCNLRNRNNMLNDSKDIYYFSNEQLDQDDYKLNVLNGTLDLSEENISFSEHNPEDLLSKICNVNYKPEATCKNWKNFLEEIMQGDQDKIRYLQKIAGLSLTGDTKEETCFILYGSTTRNGKSTFCETIIHLLGSYALTMKPESLAVKQNVDSRQANGDIARLKGARFVNASEPPKRMLFDTALLKSLLGRDSITARHLHQREMTFIPKFKLVINTNYLPQITDDTVFSSGRINVVSFDRHFEPFEQDKHLKERLRNEEELSGILNWCIEGLLLYRKEGLEPPQAVKDATNTYRSDSDKIGNFINECLVKSEKNSNGKDIYGLYQEWCNDNGFGCENKSNFFAEMKNKGLFALSGTVNGKTDRNIIKGYVPETPFEDAKMGTPFD